MPRGGQHKSAEKASSISQFFHFMCAVYLLLFCLDKRWQQVWAGFLLAVLIMTGTWVHKGGPASYVLEFISQDTKGRTWVTMRHISSLCGSPRVLNPSLDSIAKREERKYFDKRYIIVPSGYFSLKASFVNSTKQNKSNTYIFCILCT